MAVSVSLQDSIIQASASWTPTITAPSGGALIVYISVSQTTSTFPPINGASDGPLTVSGLGGTWVSLFNTGYGSRRAVRAFISTNATGTGTLTVSYGGSNFQALGVQVLNVTGVDLSTPTENLTSTSSSGTSYGPTIGGTAAAGDATISLLTKEDNTAVSQDGGWIELYDNGEANGIRRMGVAWDPDADPTPAWSWSGSNGYAGCAFRLNAAAVTSTEVNPAPTVVTAHSAVANVTGSQAVGPVASVITAHSAVANVGGQADVTPTPTIVTAHSAVANVGTDTFSVVFTDDFEGEANDVVYDPAGFTATGGDWRTFDTATGGSHEQMIIYPPSGGNKALTAEIGDISTGGHRVEGSIKGNNSTLPALVAGFADTNNFIMWEVVAGESKVKLYQRVAGSYTLLDESVHTITNDTFYELMLEVVDGDAIGYFNGVEVARATLDGGTVAVLGDDGGFYADAGQPNFGWIRLSYSGAAAPVDVAPAPTVVTAVSAVAGIGGQADVAPTPTAVTTVSAVANVGGGAAVAPAPTVVVTVSATANVGGAAGVTPSPTVVVAVSATANVGAQADVAPASSVVIAVAATASIGSASDITPAPTVIIAITPVANVGAQADVNPLPTVVAARTAVAAIGSAGVVEPVGAVVTAVAAVASVTAQADVAPTPTIVTAVTVVASIGTGDEQVQTTDICIEFGVPTFVSRAAGPVEFVVRLADAPQFVDRSAGPTTMLERDAGPTEFIDQGAPDAPEFQDRDAGDPVFIQRSATVTFVHGDPDEPTLVCV